MAGFDTVACYCTAGRGTGVFVSKELENLESTEKIEVTDGKVYFHIATLRLIDLLCLKSVERVFISVTKFSTKDVMNGSHLDIHALSRCTLKKELWQQCLENYSTLQKNRNYNTSFAKRRKLSADLNSDGPVSFRICCKCSGRISRQWSPQRLSAWLGSNLSRLMGWKVELRHPDFEVSVHLNDNDVVLGIPVTSEPLSKRGYIRHHGLRSTVAWILCSLLHIKPGEVILDPMCGKATILMEGSVSWKDAAFVGVDVSQSQLKCASENLHDSHSTSVCLIEADIHQLPMRDGSVDGVVCDLPFGQKHGVGQDMGTLYRTALAQIDRVLKPGRRVVLLTSCQLEGELMKNIEVAGETTLKSEASSSTGETTNKSEVICSSGETTHESAAHGLTGETTDKSEGNCSSRETSHKSKGNSPSSTAERSVCTSDDVGNNTHNTCYETQLENNLNTEKVLNKHHANCLKVKEQINLNEHTEERNNPETNKSNSFHEKSEESKPISVTACEKVCRMTKDVPANQSDPTPHSSNITAAKVSQCYESSSVVGSWETVVSKPPSPHHAMENSHHPQMHKKLSWLHSGSYYIKLGETHAKICTFQKQ